MAKQRNSQLLAELRQQIEEGTIQKAEAEWGGADVAVLSSRPEQTENGFYPDPMYVVTKHSLELSWVIEQLRDIFSSSLDNMNKYEFYGQLAEAANQHLYKHGDQNGEDLLLAVVKEAESMLK